MLTAAAKAIASVIPDEELSADYIIASAFNENVGQAVADAVIAVANNASLPKTPVYFEFRC